MTSQGSNTSAQHLVVFDFDHTLVDGNTDTWVTKMCPQSMEILQKHRKEGWCWTDAMDKVCELLHSQGFTPKDYNKCLKSLQFIEGMKETCRFLHGKNIQCIIISDSNTFFIQHLLKRAKLEDCFSDVFTNPAWWDEHGRLHVEHYHSHTCRTCPRNLCKKQVLKSFLSKCGKENQTFHHIVYIGDGGGDVCPSVSLKKGDTVFAKEDCSLLKKLNDHNAQDSALDVNVIPWSNGVKILEFFENLYGGSS